MARILRVLSFAQLSLQAAFLTEVFRSQAKLASPGLLPRKLFLMIPVFRRLAQACLFVLVPTTGGLLAEERDFNRSAHGTGELPMWSPLSSFEQRTIQDYPLAEQGDAEALLALYVLASGDVRTEAEFDRLKARFEELLEQMEPALAAAASDRELGETLHHGLHEFFYAAPPGGDALTAYDEEQSQLTQILETGFFNCISSSLLYSAAAHRIGLQTEGVLLPSHAFVQLTLPEGGTVEVETTSRNGFGLVHDEAFYEQELSWFEDRNLQPPLFSDYQSRKIVSAAELGLENMWNQHVQPERMPYSDRMRLAEIKGHLQPHSHEAQKNRLIYYTREFEYLNAQQDHATLLRLFDHIEDYLASVEALAAHDPAARQDAEFQTIFAWLQAARANTWAHSCEPERALTLARAQLAALADSLPEAESIRNNLYLALSAYAQRRAAAQAFDEGREAFAGIEETCAESPVCSDALALLYAEWARFYWSFQDWPATISRYQEYLALQTDSNNEKLIRGNMASAYLNWANELWFDEDREAAISTLGECVDGLPEAVSCGERRQEMEAAFHGG